MTRQVVLDLSDDEAVALSFVLEYYTLAAEEYCPYCWRGDGHRVGQHYKKCIHRIVKEAITKVELAITVRSNS